LADGAAECMPSGWCDYGEEHRALRETLESMVRRYMEGGEGEYWVPVIVAPYGSGKTTLLRHLEWYCREVLHVPVLRIELAELVNYIVERRGSIHESELPGVIEEFFRERTGEEGGVLLVDEVEEAYDILRGVVEHETSPLRGLAEAVRTHNTSVYPVLAFGPSSVLKEAVFGPVAWRSRIYTIPLLRRSVIEDWVRAAGVPEEYVQGVANMVWWASKARVAWARMLVETVVPRIAEALREGRLERLEDILLSDEALGREVVDGVPLMDRSGYREVARLIPRRLAPFMAVHVGPTPLSMLEGLGVGSVAPSPALVYSSMGVRVDDLISEAEAWLRRMARGLAASSDEVDKAVNCIRLVAEAWSRDGLIPYDQQSVRELVSLAADLAREVYTDEPRVYRLLESLKPELLAPELVRLGEPVAALRPGLLARLYPTLSSTPLIGCARSVGEQAVVEAVAQLSPEEVVKYSESIAEALGLKTIASRTGLKPVIVPEEILPAMAGGLACTAADQPILLVTATPRMQARQLPPVLESLRLMGRIYRVEAAGRLGLFLYGLLYNASMPARACSLDNLPACEERSLELHGELLRSIVLESLQPSQEARRIQEGLEKLRTILAGLGDAAAKAWAAISTGRVDPERLRERAGEAMEAARMLAEAAGAPPPPARLTALADAVAEAARLYAGLADVINPLRSVDECDLVSPLLGIPCCAGQAAGGAEEASRSLAGLEAAVGRLPSCRAVEAVREAMERARGLLGEMEDWEAALLAEPLLVAASTASEKAVEAMRAYNRVVEAAAGLPETLRRRVMDALARDIEDARSLAELAEALREAAGIVSALAEQAGRVARALSRLEELRRAIAATLDQITSPRPPAHEEEGEVVANA